MRNLFFAPAALFWAYFTFADALPTRLQIVDPNAQNSISLAVLYIALCTCGLSLYVLFFFPPARNRNAATFRFIAQLLLPLWFYDLIYPFLPPAIQVIPASHATWAIIAFPASAMLAAWIVFRFAPRLARL